MSAATELVTIGGAMAGRFGVSPAGKRTITVAVAGNPNAGKSTLINAIAGSRLQVGNWPGVTVEKKEAQFEFEGSRIRLVDLPGTYSLSPYTQEEIIARDYLVNEKPDLVINVVDATNLERNLYLTMQLLELGLPVVMALNIYDEAEAKGYRIDVKGIERMLGIPVVPTAATKGRGTAELLEAAVRTASAPARLPKPPKYDTDIEQAIDGVVAVIRERHPELANTYPLRWLACKLMEGDKEVARVVNIDLDGLEDESLGHLRRAHGEDLEALMAEARYALASGLTREVLRKPELRKTEITEKIDRVVLHRLFGIPIFLTAMWLVFKLTFDLSSPFGDWLDGMIAGPLRRWIEAGLGLAGAPDWTVSLALDGVIAGVGFVLVFVPVIFAMMFFITFLEGSGYMARAAFVMDRVMHAIGLHGKSFIPMLLGFGCNVPGIYATRTLENPRDKALTALLLPLMSCGARLPVYVLFAGIFFADSAGTVIWSLYVLGILLAVVMGVIFKKTLFRGDAPLFIMELPPYRMPTLRSLLIHTWEKGKHFLIKAGTYILAVSVFVWFLLNLPWGVESKRDSYLGRTGAAIAPIFAPLGFGTWEASASLITGIIAKEIVVGTMGEIYAPSAAEETQAAGPRPTLGEDLREMAVSFGGAFKEAGSNVVSTFGVNSLAAEDESGASLLKTAVGGAFTPLTAYAFMVFVLLYMPCVVVAIAMRQEFGSWKWFGVAFAYQSALAWSVAFIIYQGEDSWDSEVEMGIADVVWMVLILGGAGYLLYRSVWKKKGHCQGCGNVGCSRKFQVAPAVLLGCLLAPATVTLATDGSEPIEVALNSTAEIYHTPAEKKTAGLEENITKNITLSALIELEAVFSGSESSLSLGTAQLGLGIATGARIGGTLILLSEDGGPPAVDEATIDLTESRWSARLGLQYLPFGHFNTHFISDPLILELGETRVAAIQGGFRTERFALSAFAFNGDAEQAGEKDRIRDWGASLTATPLPVLEIGASYLSDLADSSAGLFANVDNTYRSRVAGWSSYAVLDLGVVKLSGEVLGAVERYTAADGGGKPQAWNIELAFAPTPKVELAARVEGSSDFPEATERRYGVAASWSPWDQVSLSAEYLRAARGDADDDSIVTARLALEF